MYFEWLRRRLILFIKYVLICQKTDTLLRRRTILFIKYVLIYQKTDTLFECCHITLTLVISQPQSLQTCKSKRYWRNPLKTPCGVKRNDSVYQHHRIDRDLIGIHHIYDLFYNSNDVQPTGSVVTYVFFPQLLVRTVSN